MLTAYLGEPDVNKAVEAIQDMHAPQSYMAELLSHMVIQTLDKSDEDRENISKLISVLKKESVITSDQFMEVSEN